MEGQCYVKTINDIDNEISRIMGRLKMLKLEKKNNQTKLYRWMEKQGLEKYQGHKIPVTKAEKGPRKKKKEKEKDAIQLFFEAGIPDPSQFYKEFIETQK